MNSVSHLRSSLLAGAIAAMVVAGAMACSQSSNTPGAPSGIAVSSLDAKPTQPAQSPQLNLSHVECVNGMVEVHFVLLFVPDGVTPGNVVTYNWGGGTGQAPRGNRTGNVWHYTDYLPSGSTVNITSATVVVNGQTISLHNPGAYAGTYNCGEEQLCSGAILPAPQSLVCLDRPLGNEASECSYFLPGSTPLGKDDGGPNSSQPASQSAPFAVVHAGSGQTGCSPGEQAYRTLVGVTAGQPISSPGTGTSISHITYCSCPTPQ